MNGAGGCGAAFDGLETRRRYDPADRAPRERAASPRMRLDPVQRLRSIGAAFDACDVRHGAVLSFHHHLRDGDAVLNAVLREAGARGLRDLTVAASSIFPVHAPLVAAMEAGVVTRVATDYIKGPAADAVLRGALAGPLLLQSHGGRARAVASESLAIDAAFVAASRADRYGAATGGLGRAACGPLGYPMVDVDHARAVVVLAEEIQDRPLVDPEIPADCVDVLVQIPSIGDPTGLATGALTPAGDGAAQALAEVVAAAVAALGRFEDGFSFQTGAGGPPLAAAAAIGAEADRRGVAGAFVAGGLTAAHVDLVRRGLFRDALSVQSFDLAAVASFAADPWHRAMSAAEYASPLHPDPAAHRLSLVVLGAAEVDAGFNVNVTLGGDGRLIGGPGGHQDTAAGAALTIIATRLCAGGFPKLVRQVGCVTTPGQDVDLIVTEGGVAVNPDSAHLVAPLRRAGLQVVSVDALIAQAAAAAARPPVGPRCGRGGQVFLEYRDGSIIDAL